LIEEKIEKQSKGMLSFFKKGRGDDKYNIINVIFIGILLILIFIIEKYKEYIPKNILKYFTTISAFLGSCIVIYGIYKLWKIKKNNIEEL